MYNRLWDEDPDVQKERAESKAEGIAQAVVLLVKARFPRLLELAQQISDLDMLVEQLAVATDEDAARRLLALP